MRDIAKMIRRLWLIGMLLLQLAWAAPCPAQAREFLDGLQDYHRGDFQQAVLKWEALSTAGLVNGKLYYNLGNAFLKGNDLGRALLWYERALTLIPSDPDLNFNYDYARSLTQDAQEERLSAWVRIVFFWKYQLSPRTIRLLALGLNLVFWALFLTWRLTRRRALRRAAWVAGLATLVFILTAAFQYMEGAQRRLGVILPEQVAVRSGLEPTSTELFKLHAGARVRVARTHKEHYQIRFSDDKIGWVPQGVVGLIATAEPK